MKTGRRRKKESQEPPRQAPSPPPETASPRPEGKKPPSPPLPSRTPSRRGLVLSILIVLALLIFGGLLCGRSCLGPRAEPSVYLPADAEGSWVTTVKLVVPQVTIEERFRSDCDLDVGCTVIPGTCEVREREDKYTEHTVDDYDDYAYNIYYEEAEDKLYEAAGDSFVVTQLNEKEDWWEENRHYFSEEWLDRETCQYTEYTVWITDPEDEEYEIEVLLAECEVWDHVVVKEAIYEEEEYCQIENVGSMTVQDTLTRQGVGATVEWAETVAPANGRLEREFEGTVIFQANGAERTVKATNVDTYIRYLTVPYYLGLDEQGNAVDLTDKAP